MTDKKGLGDTKWMEPNPQMWYKYTIYFWAFLLMQIWTSWDISNAD